MSNDDEDAIKAIFEKELPAGWKITRLIFNHKPTS